MDQTDLIEEKIKQLLVKDTNVQEGRYSYISPSLTPRPALVIPNEKQIQERNYSLDAFTIYEYCQYLSHREEIQDVLMEVYQAAQKMPAYNHVNRPRRHKYFYEWWILSEEEKQFIEKQKKAYYKELLGLALLKERSQVSESTKSKIGETDFGELEQIEDNLTTANIIEELSKVKDRKLIEIRLVSKMKFEKEFPIFNLDI